MNCWNNIASNEYRELLLDHAIENLEVSGISTEDYCRIVVDTDISVFYYRTGSKNAIQTGNRTRAENEAWTENVVDIGIVPYFSIPKCYGLMQPGQRFQNLPNFLGQEFDPLSLDAAGIRQVQGAPLYLSGRGVILGFVDTGIRYLQDVFRDNTGKSRIGILWDQTIEGRAPSGYYYGAEYTKQEIDYALQSAVPREIVPSWDENGHGTAIASVAAGSRIGNGREFVGAAPDAEIAVVKLRSAKPYLKDYYNIAEVEDAYSETDILLGVKYLEEYASQKGKPLVLCIGVGTNYGSHTGLSILDHYLDTIAVRRGRAVIVCAGNEGAARHHFQMVFQKEPMTIELRIDEGEQGFLLECWSEGPVRYRLGIQTPGGEQIADLVGRDRRTQEYRFVLDKTILRTNFISPEESSGRSLLLINFRQPSPGIWRFTLEAKAAISGSIFNMWLPITNFLKANTFFLRSESDITLTAPSMAQNVITISTYNDADGGLFEGSGRGYTADRRFKPEFVAPGVNVSTSLGKNTGSSLAAAIAAGGVAQLMQWAVVEQNYPLASSREMKYYLALGAERSESLTYPNREWGLGKINILRTFQELAGLY